MFEEGRSTRSQVIDRKQKEYRLTDMCKAVCHLFFEGGHNNHSAYLKLITLAN